MVTCGFCNHAGVHATITTSFGGVSYCTGCEVCKRELREAQEASQDTERGNEGSE